MTAVAGVRQHTAVGRPHVHKDKDKVFTSAVVSVLLCVPETAETIARYPNNVITKAEQYRFTGLKHRTAE